MPFQELRDAVYKAAIAAGNLVTRELDRESSDDDRLSDRMKKRLNGLSLDAVAKVAVSQSAQALAKFGARRLSARGLGRLVHGLAKRPLASAGVALFAYDTVRDGVRFSHGAIDSKDLLERTSGNAMGIASSTGGAVVGGVVGAAVVPVVGGPVGSLIGSVVAGAGGDAAGRALAQRINGRKAAQQARNRRRPKRDSGRRNPRVAPRKRRK